MIARLASAGELLIDPLRDPLSRDRELARVVAAFPFVTRAPDWLAFLREYGGLTYVLADYSTGFFGVSYNASMHILDGEGDPVERGCLLICDSDPPILAGPGTSGPVASGLAAVGPGASGAAGVGLAASGPDGVGPVEVGHAVSGYAAFGFDATGERAWGVYGVTTDGHAQWYAASFTEWLESFVAAIT